MKIDDRFAWKILTPDKGHYFFGYYDRCAWNHDNTKHLALKVPQCERIPELDEKADIGYVTRNGKGFVPLAQTKTWCHQQGAMTLWLKHQPESFIFNDFDLDQKKPVARIYTLDKGIDGDYEIPIYAMSQDGNWGVSLNFARIPRPGYSYAGIMDWTEKHPDLDNDGIFLVNMRTREIKLIVSYRQIISAHPLSYELDGLYWWLNHAIFNCDSSKLLFLFRSCADPFKPYPWKTHMYTVNLDGSDLICSLPDFYWNGMISHQIWGRTPNEILVDANWRGQGSDYVVYDDRIHPLQAKIISKGLGPAGHLVFSPDGKWMLADTYPENNVQTLAMVELATGRCEIIGRFRHEQPSAYPVDVRCDLHPRWSSDGSLITVDSLHSGYRKIYMIELEDISNLLF